MQLYDAALNKRQRSSSQIMCSQFKTKSKNINISVSITVLAYEMKFLTRYSLEGGVLCKCVPRSAAFYRVRRLLQEIRKVYTHIFWRVHNFLCNLSIISTVFW